MSVSVDNPDNKALYVELYELLFESEPEHSGERVDDILLQLCLVHCVFHGDDSPNQDVDAECVTKYAHGFCNRLINRVNSYYNPPWEDMIPEHLKADKPDKSGKNKTLKRKGKL